MPVKNCSLCGSSELALIIDLGEHPLADTFLRDGGMARALPRYPLRVFRCVACGHAMNGFRVPPEKRYRAVEYSYDSSNSKVAEEHFAQLAEQVVEFLDLSSNDLVVDIGGNVGTLLTAFRIRAGTRIVNVEPSPNIAALSERNSIPTLARFWDTEAAEHIVAMGGAKVITATNVLNHIDDPDAFFVNLQKALVPNGIFVAEVPYLLTLLEKTAFDTMYLEHVSYFAVAPLKRYLAKYGLRILRIQQNEYMGGSIVFYIGAGEEGEEVEKLIVREKKSGLYEEDAYAEFRARAEQLKKNILEHLHTAKNAGGRLIGIGAATKGNTLLNYCGIDTALLEYITDASPLKVGKYTPGSAIPIRGDEAIGGEISHALILAWNIGPFLKEKIKALHPNLQFIEFGVH
jgi:SAM-dependent methyltransferase